MAAGRVITGHPTDDRIRRWRVRNLATASATSQSRRPPTPRYSFATNPIVATLPASAIGALPRFVQSSNATVGIDAVLPPTSHTSGR
jgi:hypothetical protein